MNLLTITEEAAACRDAFKGVADNAAVWLCHHEVLTERLAEPAENRIAYILSDKPEHEQALRLRLFRPAPELEAAYAEYRRVKGPAYAEYQRVNGLAYAEYQRVRGPAYAEYVRVNGLAWAEYVRVEGAALADRNATAAKLYVVRFPDSPWNGKTIFPGEKP